MSCNNQNLISNSSVYMFYSSLFDDLEIITKLINKHLEEDNLSATLRCMKSMSLIIHELKENILR